MSASWYWTPLSPKPYIFTSPYCHFGAVSQSYLWCCLPGCSPHFAPDKTTWNLYIFLSWHQDPLSYTISSSLLKSMSTELMMLSNHLILYRPLLLSPSIFPSIRIISNESVLLIRMPKYWRFSFSISTSSEYLGLISLRMDWLDLFVVHGTLKSLLQHHSSKASILHQF